MAKRYNINAFADFENVVYAVPLQLLGNNRQWGTYPYTHSEQLYGTYLSYAVEKITLALGFNPFNITTVFTTGTIGFSNVDSDVLQIIDGLNINYEVFEASSSNERFSNWELSNGESLDAGSSSIPADYSASQVNFSNGCLGFTISKWGSLPTYNYTVSFTIYLFPDVAFTGDSFDMSLITNKCFQINGYIDCTGDALTGVVANSYTFTVNNNQSWSYYNRNCATLNANMDYLIDEGDITYEDSSNPYGIAVAVTGGGNGNPDMNVDAIEKVEFPDLPTLSAASAGLCTIYNPSLSQMQALSNYLWESPSFDINDFKRLFASPMDAIIGLGIIPVAPTLSGSGNVMFGNIDSGVSMPKLASQFVEKDMGSVQIKKWVDCFLDYDCTEIQIYVPFCGLYSLDPVEVMGKTLTLKYHIDCLTGGCAAMLAVDGCIMYQWNGSCIANVPLTAINYATAIQNAVSAVGNVASMASGGNPVSNLASVTNAVMNIKPQVQKGGNMGGSAGLMSVQQPYVIITRPNMSVPNKLNKFTGNTLNVTMKLGKVTGFTQVELIRLEGIPCTADEKEELLSILREGAIF